MIGAMPDLRHITTFGNSRHPRGPVVFAVLFLALQLWGCGSGDSSPQQANFSDYYPMTKGFSRTYQFTGPEPDPFGNIVIVTQDRKETLTNGATYNGLTSVRTCQSPTIWADDMASGGSILRMAGSLRRLPAPVIGTMTRGIDGWEVGQSLISSLSTFLRTNTAPIPTSATVTFRGLEDVKVQAGTFRDTMKIDFSLIIDDPNPPQPFFYSVIATEWYARGVGLVKSIESSGTAGSQQHQETLELTDYDMLPSAPPQLLTVSPTGSLVDHATEITLTGNFFAPGAQVTLGPWPAASVTVESSTMIKAVTPSQGGFSRVPRAGTYDVTVTNEDCQVFLLEDAFTFQ